MVLAGRREAELSGQRPRAHWLAAKTLMVAVPCDVTKPESVAQFWSGERRLGGWMFCSTTQAWVRRQFQWMN